MSKEKEARKALLQTQIEHAVVEHIGTEANDYPSWDVGTYSVFVPGAIRENNIVKADSEEEAKAKVLACLERKIDVMAEGDQGGSVDLQPDNLKVETKGKIEVSRG